MGLREEGGKRRARERERERQRIKHTSFRLPTTGASAAVIASPLAVVGSTSLDGDDLAVCLCRGSFGDTACIAIAGEGDRQEGCEEELDTGDHDEQEE